jgi:hypothetical protein
VRKIEDEEPVPQGLIGPAMAGTVCRRLTRFEFELMRLKGNGIWARDNLGSFGVTSTPTGIQWR